MQKADIFHPPKLSQSGYAIWNNLHGASIGLALKNAISATKKPLLIIAADNLAVAHLIEELQFFHNGHFNFLYFPDLETLPYDHFSPHQDIISERLSVLYHLPLLKEGIIITTVSALLKYLPPKEYVEKESFQLAIGDKINIDILRTRLVNAGYHAVSQVREHGEFAIRGSLIDLFPMGSKTPFRIDLLDEEVDTIRIFSKETQRTLEKITEIRLLPAKEFPLTEEAIEYFRQNWRAHFAGDPLKSPIYQDITEGLSSPGIEYYLSLFFKETATFFSYLPVETTIITIGNTEKKAQEFWQEITMRYDQGRYNITRPLLSPEQLFIPRKDLLQLLSHYSGAKINDNDQGEKKKEMVYDFMTRPAPNLDISHKATEPLSPLLHFKANYSGRILFCAETMGRREVILQLFKSIDLHPVFYPSWEDFLTSGESYGMVVAPLEEGFQLDNPSLTLLTETQLYGKRVMQRRLRKRTPQDADALIRDLTELKIEDPIVHIDHGVGRYRGLQTLKVGEQIAEYLALEYEGGDKLYVPITSLHLISRYSGADPDHIPMNKLGTAEWQKAKSKAAEKVRDVAAELLDLYAKRASRPGLSYEMSEDQFAAFSAAFPFEETPDQLQAIEKVTADMMSHRPMDRVICGDVGFGKTEVALRAAFLAVLNSKQVCLLVPTTLLAQQHLQNFQNRFADWPVQIEMLSRFRSAKEQKNILERMEKGQVDIVIGTHKLLQSNIKFKSLGLVIIDEEHRFGVKQKEQMKALRSSVDILTLTATPIPRTLNMSLAGIRDLSLIATPPARRLSVKTFVHEYQNHIIQEAIQREIMRGGQVYFLHNDVATINKKAEEISTLVPEARISVAHGQMHEHDLERIMSQFYHRYNNVLVCSTIIESGIDIPTANTIIINRADKFGLAQLHQLRGRVGRSHHQAYAYLLTPPRTQITKDAEKRLDAITSLDELGVGFTLATHDLEIRGAGELLGEEQSGNIEEIGFTLYMDLLSRTIDDLKSGKEPELNLSLLNHQSEIDLHIITLIPENYLSDVSLRLQFYKRIATAKTIAELDEIQVEMIDRFGLLPQPLKNLFAVSELKQTADRLGIVKIEAQEKSGKFEFADHPNVKPETIIRLIQMQTGRYRLEGPKRLRFNLDPHEVKDRIKIIADMLEDIGK